MTTVETVRLEALISMLLARGASVLMCGPTGTGKSVAAMQACRGLDPVQASFLTLKMNARTSVDDIGKLLLAPLEKRRKGVYGATRGRRMVAMIDDANMCAREPYGAMPPIEVLRQLLGQGGFYTTAQSSTRLDYVALCGVSLLCACGPAGGGRQPLSSRFVGQLNLIGSFDTCDASLRRIFTAMLGSACQSIGWMTHQLVSASVAVYRGVSAAPQLLPTPKYAFNVFSFGHLRRHVQGLTRATSQSVGTPERLARLWVHEGMRCYADMLIEDAHRTVVEEQLRMAMEQHMNLQWSVVVPSLRPIVYGSFMGSGKLVPGAAMEGGGKAYREIESMDQLRAHMNERLADYNSVHATMNLVLFDAAIAHVTRLCRVLELPAARMLLLGMAASGRQSLTRLAAHICGLGVHQPPPVASRWRDWFKERLLTAGRDRTRLVLLFGETTWALHSEQPLEDLSEWGDMGEVVGLFSSQEREEILLEPSLREACGAGAAATEEELWRTFCQGSLANLQLVLCMAYPSDETRNLGRKHPWVINNSIIDCFQPLPADALKATALAFLADAFGEGESGVLRMVAQCLAALQLSARSLAVRLEREHRRVCHVTPKSFLDLVSLLKDRLSRRRGEIAAQRRRYVVGLDKLSQAADDVAGLEDELEQLKKILVTATTESSELLEVVRRDVPGGGGGGSGGGSGGGRSPGREITEAMKGDVEARREQLAAQAVESEHKLGKARALVARLQREKDRWEAEVSRLDQEHAAALGDCMIAAAACVHLGPCPQVLRAEALAEWLPKLHSSAIEHSDDFSLAATFATPAVVQAWHERHGLSADTASVVRRNAPHLELQTGPVLGLDLRPT